MATEDPFMTAARGRYPLSTDSGSATSWFRADEVPLPDREYGTLWWWALAGLNHFYLRSVLPGLFKAGLLIFGGILAIAAGPAVALLPITAFGIWWAWDILQLVTEKERVIAYGMSTPFDATTGIGQGMIVDGTTQYRQRSDFVAWQLMSVLGPLGVDALLQGRPALFVRKLFDTLIFGSFSSGFFKGWINGSVSDAGLFFLFIFAALFGFFVLLPWITTVSALGHPTTMFQEGIRISPAFEKFLNYFDSWTSGFGPNTQSEVRRDFGFASVPGADLRRDFKIERHDPAAATEDATATGSGQELQTWPASLALGNVVVGPIAALVGKIVMTFRYGTEAYYAAAKMSRGETPEIPTAGLPIPKGLVDPKKLEALKKAGAAFEHAADITTTASQLTKEGPIALAKISEEAKSAIAGKLGGIASATEGALTGKLGGIASAAEGAMGIELPPAAQTGGGVAPSWESVVLGATVAALAAGGAIKATVDYLVRE